MHIFKLIIAITDKHFGLGLGIKTRKFTGFDLLIGNMITVLQPYILVLRHMKLMKDCFNWYCIDTSFSVIGKKHSTKSSFWHNFLSEINDNSRHFIKQTSSTLWSSVMKRTWIYIYYWIDTVRTKTSLTFNINVFKTN